MCVNFRPPDPELLETVMGVIIDLHDTGFWREETWKDYSAPIVRRGAGGRRAETVGQLRSFGEAGPEYSFTQLTINADDHPLMRRFHQPGDEKRALVLVPQPEWDEWLGCGDPEYARSFLRPYPAELMRAWECPTPPRTKKAAAPQAAV